MSRLFTSSSDWKRIGREAGRVLLVLLALELIVRIGPVQALLAARLDSYENLLWYDERLPRYENQLKTDPNYTIWLLGSSPMMTAWHPTAIQAELREGGYEAFTVQNYGFTTLTNLRVMSQLIDRWMLQLDQPKYVVLGISQINFSRNAAQRMRIEDSPLENVFIYPDTIDDYANQFLYRNSRLYRYLILARNAFTVPVEQTHRAPGDEGGYFERQGELTCTPDPNIERQGGVVQDHLATNLSGLDALIATLQTRDLPVLVVSLPISRCQLERNYGSLEAYQERYQAPVFAQLRQRGISVIEQDTLFYEQIAPEEQDSHFDDGTHTNRKGAALLSRWLAQTIADWLATNPQPIDR